MEQSGTGTSRCRCRELFYDEKHRRDASAELMAPPVRITTSRRQVGPRLRGDRCSLGMFFCVYQSPERRTQNSPGNDTHNEIALKGRPNRDLLET